MTDLVGSWFCFSCLLTLKRCAFLLVGSNDVDLACNRLGNEGTQLVADVSAGSTVTFQWIYVSPSYFLSKHSSHAGTVAVRFVSPMTPSWTAQ